MAVPAFTFSGLLQCGLRVARSGNHHEGMEGNLNPRGATVVEGEHFSSPGWTVEHGKEPRVMYTTKQTKVKLEESSSLSDS